MVKRQLNPISVAIITGISILTSLIVSSDIPQFPATSNNLQSQAKTPNKPISNYWIYIKKLHEEGDGLRSTPTHQRISSKKFPFELFKDLKPNEFMRACREAVRSAKEEGNKNNWTEQEILGKAFENLSLVLEYYGLYVEKTSEIDILINAITADKEEPIIRLFLIKQLNAKPPNQSILGLHLQTLAKLKKDELFNTLFNIVKRHNENPDILIETLSYLYDYLYEEYTDVLKNDSVVQAYSYTNKIEVTPSILKLNDLPRPLEKTQAELSKLNKNIKDFLVELERWSNSKNISIEKQSKKLIEMILNNFPIQNG